MDSRRSNPIYAIAVVALWLAATFIGVVFATRLPTDNRFEQWLQTDSQQRQAYEAFIERFGNDEFIVVAYHGRDLFDAEGLDAQIETLIRLEDISRVEHVSGIPAVYLDLFNGEDPKALQEEIMTTPFYKDLFVNPAGTVAGLLLQTRPGDTPDGRRHVVNRIEMALGPLENAGYRTAMAGTPVLNTALDRTSTNEARRIVPYAILVTVAGLLVIFRCPRAAFTAAACSGVTVAVTLGMITVTGGAFNMVTSAVPPVLWTLALANGIHIISRYRYHHSPRATPEESLNRALAETRYPCILSGITTAMGFLSLTLADMTPIRELGIYAAAGILLSVGVNITLAPALLRLLRPPGSGRAVPLADRTVTILLTSINRFAFPITALSALAIAAGLTVLPRIDTDNNPLDFLGPDAPISRDYAFVSQNLTGLYSLEIIINTPGGWLSPDYWRPIAGVANALETHADVPRVFSPLDFLKKLNQWNHDLDPQRYRLPESEPEARQLLEDLSERGQTELARLVTARGDAVRLSVLIGTMESAPFAAIVQRARAALAQVPGQLTGAVTGLVLQLEHAQDQLVSSQLKSFGGAFLLVFLAILAGLRSIRLMALSILPNLLPILTVFATMALAGITLDVGTVMVASVALGIAVDDTVHLLAAFNRRRHTAEPIADDIRGAVREVGPALATTTLVASAGFITLGLSSFVPISFFGLLSAIASVTALFADIILVPALLFLINRFR